MRSVITAALLATLAPFVPASVGGQVVDRSMAAIAAPPTAPTPLDIARTFEVWLFDDSNGSHQRVSLIAGAGRESVAPSISADGRRIVFHSDADFLGEGIPNGTDELWLYDVPSRRLTRITRASSADRDSQNPSISADGSRIAFESNSDFLSQGLEPRQREIWVYEVASGALRRLTSTPAGQPAASTTPVISADGSRVAFTSTADLIAGGPANPSMEIWLADVASGALTRVTSSAQPQRRNLRPALDATGRRVVFESDANPSGDAPVFMGQMDIWLYDVPSAALTRVTNGGADPTRASEAASVSADGTRIVFHSDADLERDGHPDSVDEIWMYDTRTSSLERLTHTWQPERDAGKNAVLHPDAQYPEITPDGSKVVFAADGDYLSEGIPNGYPHVWVYDIATRGLRRVDARASGSGTAIDATATRIALFRTDFDQIRMSRVTAVASGPAAPRPQNLSAEQVRRDLDAVQADLEGRWAYLKANGVDYRAAIDRVRARGANGMAYADYALEVLKIISMFIDGHAAVGGVTFPAGNLPFLIEFTGDRFVAIRSDRSAFVDAERPFITHIDGRPMSEWLTAASAFVADASPQWTTRNALGIVRRVQFMRGQMGLPVSDQVVIRVAPESGGTARDTSLAIPAAPGYIAPQPTRGSRLLEGNIGYLRIASMDNEAVTDVNTWMPRFRDTRALIVDVRGNTGGSRDALRALFPFLMSETDLPRVVNAAKYKLHPDYAEDHLGGSRYMYREHDANWTTEERAAIARFKQNFQPEWTPPEAEFSDWHYLVMSRRTNPAAYYYDRPVIVLTDQNSFSATDIFVSAFKGWRNVRLVGTPSGGGSARQMAKTLPVSGIMLNLASMASFQLNGRLYDGNGTEPDVLVHPEPGSFLRGGRDNILERAIQLLTPVP